MSIKVTIEITAKGWTKTVVINKKEYKQNWKLTNYGAKQGDVECFDELAEIDEKLTETVEGLCPYGIARYLAWYYDQNQ